MARAAAVWLLLSAGAICAAQPAPRPDAPPDAELAALDQTLVDLGLDAGALAFEDGVALTRALLTGERRAAWLGALLKQRGAAPVASRTALDRELGWLDAVRARCEALASPGGVAATTFRDARLMTSEQWGALARGSQSARGALVLAHTVNVVADVEIRGAGGEARSSFAADQPMEVALAIRSREAEPVIRAVGLKLTLTRAVAGAAPVTHEFPSVALASAGGPEQVWRLEADAARPTGEWTLGVSVTSADAAWPASTSAELVKLAEPVTAAITITAPAVANNGGAGAPPVASTSRTENLSRWSMASLLRGLADPASQAAVEWYLGLSANEPPNVANWVPANAAPLFAPDATVAQPTIGQF